MSSSWWTEGSWLYVSLQYNTCSDLRSYLETTSLFTKQEKKEPSRTNQNPALYPMEDLEILWLMIRYGWWFLVKGGHGTGTLLLPLLGSLEKMRQQLLNWVRTS